MLKFPRSFLFSSDPFNPPEGLQPVALPSGFLAISGDHEAAVGAAPDGAGGALVVLIGYAIDLDEPTATVDQIAQALADVAAMGGREPMLAHSDRLLGRFAAICRIGGEWWVFNDACATRPVYFAEHVPFVASHSTLIGRRIRAKPRTAFFIHYRFGLPGNRTVFPRVRVLPANFALRLNSRTITRFWPREPRREMPARAIVPIVTDLFRRSAEAIAARWTPCVSVTAGLDSRVTLAAFRYVQEAIFFTYDRGPIDRVDVEVARLVCSRLRREHRCLTMPGREEAPELYAATRSLHDYRHFIGASAIYAANFSAGSVHVRSNLAEIGRAYWRQHTGTGSFDPSKCVRILETVSWRSKARHEESIAFATDRFVEFFRDLGYDQLDPANPELLGYDGWDLFYWEHRMSTWHSQLLMGSDFTFDTAILFNSRRVLSAMLAAPLQDRLRGTVLRRYIRATCPELVGIPVNPKDVSSLPARRPFFRWPRFL